jgi:dihydrofolate synthase/folylpolyglutamate synthase
VTLEGTEFTVEADWTALTSEGMQPAPSWAELVAGGRLTLTRVRTSLLGEHQVVNASTAALAAIVASSRFPRLDAQALRRGLASVVWPGRLQVLGAEPTIVVDGAHTPESARALAVAMRALFPGRRIILVFGMQGDKDIPASARPLADVSALAVATRAHHPRAAQPQVIASALRMAGMLHVEERDDPRDALRMARELAAPADVILVTGSLYLVADALTALVGGAATHLDAPVGSSST